MEVGEKELQDLAEIIVRKLKEEFNIKHLSGNLINTMKIENYGNEIKINIPAQTYNMLLYQMKGVVVHTSNGSYASKLEEEGSKFYKYPNGTRKGSKLVTPGNHKGYIDRVVNMAILEWQNLLQDTKVEKVEG